MGLCLGLGAATAFRTATEDPRVVGVVMVDPIMFPTRQ
jgi:hypothetical protein